MRTFRLLTALFLVMALAGAAPTAGPASASTGSKAVVAKVNEVRTAHGLARVRASSSLQRSSTRYSAWMLRRNYFGHVSAIRASHRFRLRGEVLARTAQRRPSAAQVVRWWLNSPTHRAVLLNARYRYIGIGQVRGRTAGSRKTVITGHLGAR